jgi:hypothetical protein
MYGRQIREQQLHQPGNANGGTLVNRRWLPNTVDVTPDPSLERCFASIGRVALAAPGMSTLFGRISAAPKVTPSTEREYAH